MSIASELIALDALLIAASVSASVDMPCYLSRQSNHRTPDERQRLKKRRERKSFVKQQAKRRRKQSR